jgi:hypothetical protein
MACGCGGSSNSAGAASGPLLSGALDGGAYLPGDAAPDDSGIAAADVGASLSTGSAVVHSGGFWLLVVLIIGTAWYLDSKKSGDA